VAAPIVLVPGFWLGAWAWDEVAEALRADGHDVTAVTLPGLAPGDDPASVTFADHVDAIRAAVEAAGPRVVLAVHSGAGTPGYAASDRVPERIAAMVYVDSAPGKGPANPGLEGDWVLPSWEDLDENLDGLTDEHLARFRDRAVPQPGGTVRGGPEEFRNDARLDVPSTVICTGFSSAQVKEAVEEGYAWLAGLKEVRDVTFVDLPTSHWPMWSRPAELAEIISGVARSAS